MCYSVAMSQCATLACFPYVRRYNLGVKPLAYLVYPLNLPIYGQVIHGGAGGAFMARHVHADQVQVLGKELKTQTVSM